MFALPPSSAGAQAGQPPVAPEPVVRLPFPQDDGTLTPYTFELGYSLVTLIYDTLLWRDANGVPQPWLARAVEPSADGRQLTIRLAEGAAWHDGKPVTAADVAFTFDFVATHPHPRFTPELRAVEKVVVADPATVVIILRHASPGFVDQPLSDLPILPAHLWQGLPRNRLAPEGLPVGSGPYRLVDYRPKKSYRFEANTGYFRGPPAVSTLEIPIIGDASSTLQALDRRRVDMIPVSLPEGAAARVEGLGTKVREGPSYLGTVLMFNLRTAPFDRPEVRRAISEALDLRRISRAVGTAVPADRGYLHPASPWASKTVLHQTRAVAAARSELAKLALPPIEVLAADNDPVKLEAGRQVALALERGGVRATSRGIPRHELSRAVGEEGGQPTFGAAIWTSPPLASYDPDFLRRLFGSAPGDATFNYPGYRNPAFDDLTQRIAQEPVALARREATAQALGILAADLPVVPLFFSTGTFTYRPAIYDGWVFVKGSGILDKRSFVDSRPPAPADETRPPPDDEAAAEDEDESRSPIAYAAIGVLGLALLLGMVGLVTARRR